MSIIARRSLWLAAASARSVSFFDGNANVMSWELRWSEGWEERTHRHDVMCVCVCVGFSYTVLPIGRERAASVQMSPPKISNRVHLKLTTQHTFFFLQTTCSRGIPVNAKRIEWGPRKLVYPAKPPRGRAGQTEMRNPTTTTIISNEKREREARIRGGSNFVYFQTDVAQTSILRLHTTKSVRECQLRVRFRDPVPDTPQLYSSSCHVDELRAVLPSVHAHLTHNQKHASKYAIVQFEIFFNSMFTTNTTRYQSLSVNYTIYT